MWIYLPWGFFSVIKYSGDDALIVRARRRKDLETLRTTYLPQMGPISTTQHTDYPHRARVPAESFAQTLARIVLEIDYSNVKGATAATDPTRLRTYFKVHQTTALLNDTHVERFAEAPQRQRRKPVSQARLPLRARNTK